MKSHLAVALVFMSLGLLLGFCLWKGSPIASAGGDGAGGGTPTCSSKNGDVNGDGNVDLSDAVTILGNLFLGTPQQLLPLCAPQSPSALPDTGQKSCEEFLCPEAACFADDSSYATGCPPEGRFADNGDGTVTDNCTGLMWQKEAAVTLPWCEALSYCENLSTAGHEDWRLPNVRELQSMVDYGRAQPSSDPVFDSWRTCWSSTSLATHPASAWAVSFIYGEGTYEDKTIGYFVRAVRTAP